MHAFTLGRKTGRRETEVDADPGYTDCRKGRREGRKGGKKWRCSSLEGRDLLIPREIRAGKKNQSPQSFFSAFFPFLFLFFPLSPSFFLAPVSPPINAANKNNERPPARTLHPLVPVLIRSSSGGRWFAVRKGRRLLLQTASRQREDTGLCTYPFTLFLSPSSLS